MRSDAGRDGCQCPPWVKPCAHFEGQVVYVVAATLTGWYEVHGPTTILVESEDPKVRRHSGCVPLRSRDLPAAKAEFERRAEDLRQAPFVNQAQEQ